MAPRTALHVFYEWSNISLFPPLSFQNLYYHFIKLVHIFQYCMCHAHTPNILSKKTDLNDNLYFHSIATALRSIIYIMHCYRIQYLPVHIHILCIDFIFSFYNIVSNIWGQAMSKPHFFLWFTIWFDLIVVWIERN